MRKLGDDIPSAIGQLGGNDPQTRINLRAHQVRSRYKQALETVYGAQAQLFLAHTNNVYIMNKQDVRTLIVYVDESIFAAELNAQRELIKLKLLELFGEDIEEFEILISRGNYKDNHPYSDDATATENGDLNDMIAQVVPSIPLDTDEQQFVENAIASIDDPGLRDRVAKAMTADLEWKKGEKVKISAENQK